MSVLCVVVYITKWNTVGKHKCDNKEAAVVTSKETMYELLAEDGKFQMICGQDGADAVAASDVNQGRDGKKTKKKHNMVRELQN